MERITGTTSTVRPARPISAVTVAIDPGPASSGMASGKMATSSFSIPSCSSSGVTRVTPEEEQEGIEKEDVAIFPLAIPLLAGPGSIATVTALMGRAGRTVLVVPVILSIAITCFVSYAMLRAAASIARVFGVTGMNVINRVIGLIIGAVAVQFVFDGLADSFP